ncbi:MAG: cytochrome C peroxidase, partial [Chitinophagaceae bacterium]|nr:cytochrome C peroxidase [Chitinophagaceae bacterium]
FAIEYFFGNSARNLNGPPLPEIEAEEHTVIDPGGFQVIEDFLFPYDALQNKELLREAGRMKSIITRTKTLWEENEFRDDQVFDALRLQCFRIITLGISGFDTPLSFKGIDEVPETLTSIKEIIEFYSPDKKIAALFDNAINYASSNNHFNEFDRLTFITDYINPITTNIHGLQRSLNISTINNVYALNGDAATLFDSAAFNINYFTPDANSYTTPEKIALGKKLFYDPVLSGNNKVSCSSCHQPEKAFTDGLTKSKALSGQGFLPRNTPTLINAALQRSQFYDMRSFYLEDQVRNVIENKDEIHGDMKKAAAILGISERDIQVALSCYIRSLTSFNSRFDKYMRGDKTQLNAEEKTGFNLFMGKAKCGICHFMPVFNGTVPPAFTFTESEVIGVPADKEGKMLDNDPGRYAIYKIDNFKNAFKTPTVRNIELTAPYMHNGVYNTLDEVVEFYNRGGGAGIGLKVDNQTLPFDSLSLNATEKKAIIAFMNSLSDNKY